MLELERRTPTLQAAKAYLQGGLSVIPIRSNGTKAPAMAWEEFQKRLATDDEAEHWWGNGKGYGVGVVGGKVSGNLEHLDFDHDAATIFPAWAELVEVGCPGLMTRLSVRRTPSRGYHVSYRCPEVEIPGNSKLAMTADGKTLIETRGEGGQVLAPGCPPECHPTGKTYEHHSGPKLSQVQTITAEERAILWRCAYSFDAPKPQSVIKSKQHSTSGGLSPGDDYSVHGPDWADILDGWYLVHQRGNIRYWRRPGKDVPGWSATTGYCNNEQGHDMLAVFSSNAAPFDGPANGRPCSCHTKFAAYALLNHHGDFKAAAKALAADGYGERREQPATEQTSTIDTADQWPSRMAPEAYHGLAGDIVRAIDPHSEADPAAILTQTLISFGNAIGRTAHFRAEGDYHYLNNFVVLVGPTAKGRKGSSWGQTKRILEIADPTWMQRCTSGLSSGEGLMWHVRDPRKGSGRDKAHDPGVSDKRLLAYEPEFALVLKQIERQGNSLSAILRQVWDCQQRISSLTTGRKEEPVVATGAHISMIGHITADELRRYLSNTETANGFGNRIIWVCTRRSKSLPDGSNIPTKTIEELGRRMEEAIRFGRKIGELKRNEEAREIWHAVYENLSEGKPGLTGSMLARAEAHTMRFACIYALLDKSQEIRAEHLTAALALWDYCEQSVRYIFGDSTGDGVADEILRLLRVDGKRGVTRTEIINHFGRNESAARINRALANLAAFKLAYAEMDAATNGRPAERWFAATTRIG